MGRAAGGPAAAAGALQPTGAVQKASVEAGTGAHPVGRRTGVRRSMGGGFRTVPGEVREDDTREDGQEPRHGADHPRGGQRHRGRSAPEGLAGGRRRRGAGMLEAVA